MFIDYEKLAKSVPFYEEFGYKRIEVPWTVSKAISDITKPKNVAEHTVVKSGKEKVFVASGEQSFLSLINKSQLPAGKYQTITPCMRDDTFGPYHTKYFIKNELIHFGNFKPNHLNQMVSDALEFLSSIMGAGSSIKKVETGDGFDIILNGIEVGSYGIRECEFVRWIYGTGVAEPRFSMADRNKE